MISTAKYAYWNIECEEMKQALKRLSHFCLIYTRNIFPFWFGSSLGLPKNIQSSGSSIQGSCGYKYLGLAISRSLAWRIMIIFLYGFWWIFVCASFTFCLGMLFRESQSSAVLTRNTQMWVYLNHPSSNFKPSLVHCCTRLPVGTMPKINTNSKW